MDSFNKITQLVYQDIRQNAFRRSLSFNKKSAYFTCVVLHCISTRIIYRVSEIRGSPLGSDKLEQLKQSGGVFFKLEAVIFYIRIKEIHLVTFITKFGDQN